MVFLKSLSYVLNNYKSKTNKERRKSDSQISYVYDENYEEEPMKISTNNSFNIFIGERQYFRSGSEMIMYNKENNEC